MADPVERPSTPLDGALAVAPDLEGFLRRRGHGDAARDLVQDLYVHLLTRREALDAHSPGRFRSFLFAVAYRLGANAARRRRRDGGEPPDEARLAAQGPSPERFVLLREDVRRAEAALDALSPEIRRTLLLVADEGRSVRDVSTLLEVSEEVVRARLSRGRKRLAAILGLSLAAFAALVFLFHTRPTVGYVIRGDSTGVVLTGPDMARRAETAPHPSPSRRGDRT